MSLIDQCAQLLLVEHITSSEIGNTCGDALLGLRIGEQLQGRLDRLEILSGKQYDVLTAVAGDVDALVRC